MSKLSENDYLRNYYIATGQVPTQSVMIERMTPSLANIYFKSMTPKLKVLAGLEPPLKGGGSDWFVPPGELLKGRAVKKPIKKEYLTKLGFNGIDIFGDKLLRDHHKSMEDEKRRVLLESDLKWKATVEASCCKQWDETSREQAKQNTVKIQRAFYEFSTLYRTSITNIETLLFDAAVKEIKRVEEEVFTKMSQQFAQLLKQQATMLYDRYAIKLNKEKIRQRDFFINTVENARTEMANKLHDIHVEKHAAIEKLRVLLECQNLACQAYVALKEREECKTHLEQSKHEHEKHVKIMCKQVQMQDFEIRLAREKELKRQNFIRAWQKKVCLVVKKLQIFVKYCFNALPEHADFFINMEKLMLLQLGEAMEYPSVGSVFVPDEPTLTPVPKPHPFFLFCDKGFKPLVDSNLCPKHCTSSASQLPVIVINKRCIYAACDNLDFFSEKVRKFLDGQRGDEADFIDDHDYQFDIPVKCTSSDQPLLLKLESSLMKVLNNEFSTTKMQSFNCFCNKPTCSCERLSDKKPLNSPIRETIQTESKVTKDYGHQLKISRNEELEHTREPKWESYLEYLMPKRCKCAKRAKRQLDEHLPVYMRNMSPFDVPDLPHYKSCTVADLKNLVKNAQTKQSLIVTTPVKMESKTRDIATQCTDQIFDFMCTCFSEEEIDKLIENLVKDSKIFAHEDNTKFSIVNGSLTPTYLQKGESSFAQDRALSLRFLVEDKPELKELFKKQDCNF